MALICRTRSGPATRRCTHNNYCQLRGALVTISARLSLPRTLVHYITTKSTMIMAHKMWMKSGNQSFNLIAVPSMINVSAPTPSWPSFLPRMMTLRLASWSARVIPLIRDDRTSWCSYWLTWRRLPQRNSFKRRIMTMILEGKSRVQHALSNF